MPAVAPSAVGALHGNRTCCALHHEAAMKIVDVTAENTRAIERGDRPIPFRKLRQILGKHDCSLEHSPHGSNMKITRAIRRGSVFKRPRVLTTNISYGGEGREVPRSSINKVRAELQIDEEHGIDSAAFSTDLPFAVDDFIVKYRKTLNRLAKL